MVIDKEEGLLLATATADLAAQFDIAPDPKTRAIIGVIMACGTVYGPRAVMIKMRKAQEKAERAANDEGAGKAGVYTPSGFPAGTTDFRVGQASTEWPLT